MTNNVKCTQRNVSFFIWICYFRHATTKIHLSSCISLIWVGIAKGRSWDEFYILRPYTLLSYTYSLPYPCRDEKLNLISVPDGFGYPRPIPAVDNFCLIKNKSIFQPRSQCCNALSSKKTMVIDDHVDGEDRGRECEI